MIPMGKFAIRGASYMPGLYLNPTGERSNILLCKIRGWVFFENCRCSPPTYFGVGGWEWLYVHLASIEDHPVQI